MARRGKDTQFKLDITSVAFSLFTEDELRKLCSTKIITPLSFDALGYPLPGGLYDKKLGPLSEKSDPCGTCNKNFIECPGHFGFIELPLPVVNPLFHKTIQSIIKMTCLNCYKLQVSDNIKRIISTYMKFLDMGMISEAKELESFIEVESDEPKNEDDSLSPQVSKGSNRLKKLLKMAKSIGQTELSINKTTESLRNIFTHTILKMGSKKVCIHCKSKIEKVQSFKTKLMTSAKPLDDEMLSSPGIKIMQPDELRRHLRQIWLNDSTLLNEIFPVLNYLDDLSTPHPTDVFFMEILPVPPPNVRPCNFVDRQISEHARTTTYKAILETSILLRQVLHIVQQDDNNRPEVISKMGEVQKGAYETTHGKTPIEKLHSLWEQLQGSVDAVVDREMSAQLRTNGQGLKQIIEKKAGIIRMHMMGKRVNFAARSVITPDPNLNIDEIGIPVEFAKCLTYPVPVTPYNVETLREAILNGPKVHPGATMVEFGGKRVRINPDNKTQQESILKQLLTPDEEGESRTVKIVHRHLQNGDVLLLNRQPTLHRPSIMAHTARVLKGEKTLRLHYSNCKAYNADFDGDEMNAHFPQNELARSEAYQLAHVSNQYLVPKDGTPLGGLIQDHVISGVLMSVRGQFFTRADYQQLVYVALGQGNTKTLPPAMLKPKQLWSGKQVISSVILNILPGDKTPINLRSKAKIGAKAWANVPKINEDMSEGVVLIRNGELLQGVLDKQHYGATPFGLIHCVYELYGGIYATKLLSAFAKLFTAFLQIHGFTLGVKDILVRTEADSIRTSIIKESRGIGHRVASLAVDSDPDNTSEAKLATLIETEFATNPKFSAQLDRQYKHALDGYTNEINRACMPIGLLEQFPSNNLQLMVLSGAKGSSVNTMQISCCLGQIELEGKRPPRMVSGRTLPCFLNGDTTPRAGGFIDGRFMTGIQPPEFFFHCMAGREGLIDTAVKTSRSGYLQRCLVKHFEGLRVAYDLTVRDGDGSVVQYLYGEDGMDVSKAQFLNEKQLPFLIENYTTLADLTSIETLKKNDYDTIKSYQKVIKKWKKTHGDLRKVKNGSTSAFALFSEIMSKKLDLPNGDSLDKKSGRTRLTLAIIELWRSASPEIKETFALKASKCPDPLPATFQPDHYFGSLNDRLDSLFATAEMTKPMNFNSEMTTCTETKMKTKPKTGEMIDSLKVKAMNSLAAPGEPVGLLAAQSIGEPSTQMTLNTFHFAGRGEMNVTLGIPRLREILMMASTNIKTPSMEIPLKNVTEITDVKSETLRKSMTRVTVSDVLEKIDVTTKLQALGNLRQHVYQLRFNFLPYELYRDEFGVSPKKILHHMTKRFFGEMFTAIRKVTKISTGAVLISDRSKKPKKSKKDDDNDDGENEVNDSGDDDQDDDDEIPDLEAARTKNREDQEPSDSERENSDSDSESNVIREGKNMKKADEFQVDENDSGSGSETERKVPRLDKSYTSEAYRSSKRSRLDDDGIEAKVIDSYAYAQKYTYDKSNYLWCELTFCLPMTCANVDLTALLKTVASKSVITEVEGIKRAITYKKNDSNLVFLRTDGINLYAMFSQDKILDINRLYSNDIHAIARTYGIEAARRVIVKEVKDVFNVYGISIDPRHLLLIADYMTYNGTYEPLSRKGMESSASPLQQMSFESSLTFLKSATVNGKTDKLGSPSSCLMLGKPCKTGTGSFDLRQRFVIK